MKLEWTPSGGTIPVTLGDDATRFAIVVEQLGGTSIVQVDPLAGGANPALFARGNMGGDFVFRSSKSYESLPATYTQFKAEYARLNQKGTIVLTQTDSAGTTTMTFANAILKGVQRLFDGQNVGVHMGIRYTFAITTIT